MIGLATNRRGVYDGRKKPQIGNWMKNQNPILYIELSSIDVWRWIFAQSMKSQKEILIYAKLK
jgi:hypothetical protein